MDPSYFFLSEASKPALTPETTSRGPRPEGRYRGGRSSGAPLPPTDLATTEELETPAHLRPGSPVGGPDSHVHTLRGGLREGREANWDVKQTREI